MSKLEKPVGSNANHVGVKGGEAVECCSKEQSQLHPHSSMSVMKRHPSTTWSSINNMPKDIAVYAIDRPPQVDVKVSDKYQYQLVSHQFILD